MRSIGRTGIDATLDYDVWKYLCSEHSDDVLTDRDDTVLNVTWRPVRPRPPECLSGVIDETGRQLKVPAVCHTCNMLTVRYDTVAMEPMHRKCRRR